MTVTLRAQTRKLPCDSTEEATDIYYVLRVHELPSWVSGRTWLHSVLEAFTKQRFSGLRELTDQYLWKQGLIVVTMLVMTVMLRKTYIYCTHNIYCTVQYSHIYPYIRQTSGQ